MKKVCGQHGKNAYPSYSVALRSALRASKKRGTPLRIYFDSSCGSFHLTKRERLGWREDGAASKTLFWFVVDTTNDLLYKAFKVIDNALADLGGDD